MDIDEATKVLVEERAEAKRLQKRQDEAVATVKRWFTEHPDEKERIGPEGRVECQRSSQRHLDLARVKAALGPNVVDYEHDVPVMTVRASAVSDTLRASLGRVLGRVLGRS